MRLRTKENIQGAVALLLVFLLLYAVNARAGDKIIQSNKTAQDVSVAGDDSLGIGLATALGSESFGDCFASTQMNIVVYAHQKSKFNPWCAAVWYDANGMHGLAAQMRCLIPEIAGLNYAGTDCVTANTITPRMESVAEKVSDTVNNIVLRQEAITAPLRDDIQTLYQTIEKLEESHREPETPPQQTIIQQPFLNDAKREALAAIRGDE